MFGCISGQVSNVIIAADSYVKGNDYVGGVCGYNYCGTITNCINKANIFSEGSQGGGICGAISSGSGKITDCINEGDISGNGNAGGVCGDTNAGTNLIENCYNKGSITGKKKTGGIIGSNSGQIKNCYNIGDIKGGTFSSLVGAGGICGYNSNQISYCYSNGKVAGGENLGGICGISKSQIQKCYYDSDNYRGNAVGKDEGKISNTLGKTTKAFKNGEVCYLLQSGQGSMVWGQTIGTDEAPVLTSDSAKTIYATTGCVVYSNTEFEKTEKAHNVSDADFRCIDCGQYEAPILNKDVYEISNASQLYWFAEYVNKGNTSAKAVLKENIEVNKNVLDADGKLSTNASGYLSWTPIGNEASPYTGTFDGNGKTISGLYFDNNSTSYVGLFGYVGSGGAISNVGVVDSYINGLEYLGGVCGYNNGTIKNSYYDNIAYSSGSAVGGKEDTSDVCGKASSSFTGGEVAYLLQNSDNGVVWGQDLSATDSLPALNGRILYRKCDGISYTNDVNSTAHDYQEGICTICHDCKLAELSEDSSYFEIENKGNLYWFAAFVNLGNTTINAKLMADIELNSGVFNESGELADTSSFFQWTPIGTSSKPYEGTFDGNGKIISGLYFDNNSTDYAGLFGYLGENGKVSKFGVVDSYIKGKDNVGGICGYNLGIISNTYYTGVNSGGSVVGGVCGYNGNGLNNSFSIAKLSGSTAVGGVCGQNESTIQNCFYDNTAYSGGSAVAGAEDTSDVCGKASSSFTDGEVAYLLQKSYNGEVWGQNLSVANSLPDFDGTVIYKKCSVNEYTNDDSNIGHNYVDDICTKCHDYKEAKLSEDSKYYEIESAGNLCWFASYVNKGNTSANAKLLKDIVVNKNVLDVNGKLSTDAGGFLSWTPIGNYSKQYTGTFDGNGKTISGLYFNNSDTYYVGLFGYVGSGGNISNVGVVDSYFGGKTSVGSVCGQNGGTIQNCYNTGSVTGMYYVGSVCGRNDGTIQNGYNTGSVSGTQYVGGVCGASSKIITNCYFDSNNYGGGAVGERISYSTITDVKGKTTAQFEKGEVCYLLQRGQESMVWGQTIGTDKAPVLTSNSAKTVYVTTGCVVYSNTEPEKTEKAHRVSGADFRCIDCGQYEAPILNKDVYEISNASQLYWFAEYVNKGNTSAKAILKENIVVNKNVLDVNGKLASDTNNFVRWTPIGNNASPYTGTFDGNGKTISGLYFDSSTNYVGLFGYVGSDGTISNVCVVDSYFCGKSDVGSLCGKNEGTIQNCYNTGTVSGNEYVSGVCGINYGTITSCYNTGTVSGEYAVGGECGKNEGTITSCYNTGTVSGKNAVGGVCGYNSETIKNCYFDSNNYSGGAVDNKYSLGTIIDVEGKTTNQFAKGEVAYLLNGKKSEGNEENPLVWYQNIDKKGDTADAYPVLDSTHAIVYVSAPCPSIFSNTNNLTAVAHIFEKDGDENHKCKNCGLVTAHSTATLTYTANDTKITVTCDECSGNLGTVTLSAPSGDLTYNGSAKAASLTNNVTGVTISTPTITYSKAGDTTFSGTPKDAGTYTASITLGSATVSVTYEIKKATLTVTEATATSRVYDTTKEIAITEVTLSGVKSEDTVSVNTTNLNGTLNSANAGTYTSVILPTLTLTGADAGNYTLVQPTDAVSTTVIISKANAEITVGTDTYNKTFGNDAFKLGVTDNNTDESADVTYAVSDSKNAAGTSVDNDKVITVDASGKVTIVGAGSATITASLAESNNFTAADSKTIIVTVAKKTGYTVNEIQESYLFSKDTEETIDLSKYIPDDCGTVVYGTPQTTDDLFTSEGAPAITDGKLTYTVKQADTYGAEGTIKVNISSDNYADVEITVKLKLIDKIPVKLQSGSSVSLVSNTLTYGEALSTLTFNSAVFVDGDGTEVTGTLDWVDKTVKPTVAVTSAAWKFTPDDSDYETLSGNLTIKVEKAEPNVKVLPTVADRIYHPNAKLADTDLTGATVLDVNGEALAGTWNWKTADVIPTVNNSGYEAVFTPDDTANYKTITKTITVNVTKATPYIETTPAAAAITYSKTLADATLTGGSVQYSSEDNTAVDGTFAWKVNMTKPAVADSDKTAYTVVFTPTNKNYNTVETDITVTVNKAESAPNKPKSAMEVDYGKKRVSDITTLPEGWAWQDADKDTALTVGTAVKATAVYTGADKGNYETESVEISITRQECTHATTEVKNAKDATCTNEGYTGDTCCTVCGKVITAGKDIDALGHSFAAEFTVDVAPTCAVAGSKSRHCTRCEEVTDVTVIDKLTTHNYVNGVCSVCDDIFKTTVNSVTYQVMTEIGADGKPVGKLVTVSGNEIPQVAVAVIGTGDDFAEKNPDGKVTVPSEITGSGSDQTFVVTKLSGNAFSGASVTEIVVPATVTEVGTGAFGTATTITFKGNTAPLGIAGAITETVTTVNVPEGAADSYREALGDNANIVEVHTHVKDEGTRVEPTCEKKGSITYKCTKCGEVVEVVEIDATGHTWDAGTVTKEPTETAEGEKTYTCTACGGTKTEPIPKKEAAAPQPPKDDTVTPESPKQDADTPEQPKKGDVVADDKASAKVEVADATKKEVEYKAPANKKAKTVTIPATVKINGVTYKVTQISDNAFKGNKTVTKVTVGNNIKTIGKNAFSGATKLKKVTIGKNVKEIEANAFKGCSSLTSITLPSNVTKIGANAFSGCKKLKTLTIKSTKLTSKTVAKNAFKGLTKATTIKVPKKKLEAYKKLFKSKGLSSEVEVKGY